MKSDLELTIRWAKGAVIVAVMLWEFTQLARRPRDLPLRVLALGLFCLAFAATFGINTPFLDPVKDFFGPAFGHIINTCWMTMAYCWSAYFLLANTRIPEKKRKRKALIEFGILVIAVTVMITIRATMPELWQRPHLAEEYQMWQRTLWYVSESGYSLTVWFVGIWRAVAIRRQLHHRWARAAFWLAAVGTAGMALGVNGISLSRQIIRQWDPKFDPDLFTNLYSIGQLSGQFILALGLALIPLAALFAKIRAAYDRRQRNRYARKMAPLWRTLTTEFPYVALEAGTDDEFEKVTVEIADGLSELARDCDEPTGDMRDPAVAAGVIAVGLERRAARRDARWAGDDDAPAEPPYPRLEPDLPTWRRRARWMIAVGEHLAKRGVIEDGARVSTS
ncbi:hypothetical protein EV193_101365 [Herbihabitans rhizosphaerae]|uniref:DUF6545 domain-containing protein n=1 Tax=Herbihabitans rhizosphaerae TaxID=1872711 RepID=A0A4Q7L4D6_9PSEU|nr:MAB_1171c family putative transporter [Herbihabitans rhizosphaerae]RZS44489.1 hypothetical protein EV193_101365 [Herbihabitans rhizosphaerae]